MFRDICDGFNYIAFNIINDDNDVWSMEINIFNRFIIMIIIIIIAVITGTIKKNQTNHFLPVQVQHYSDLLQPYDLHHLWHWLLCTNSSQKSDQLTIYHLLFGNIWPTYTDIGRHLCNFLQSHKIDNNICYPLSGFEINACPFTQVKKKFDRTSKYFLNDPNLGSSRLQQLKPDAPFGITY